MFSTKHKCFCLLSVFFFYICQYFTSENQIVLTAGIFSVKQVEEG